MSTERRIQKLEEEVRWLRRQLAHVPVRVTPGVGAGTFRILQYENFRLLQMSDIDFVQRHALVLRREYLGASLYFTTATGEVGT